MPAAPPKIPIALDLASPLRSLYRPQPETHPNGDSKRGYVAHPPKFRSPGNSLRTAPSAPAPPISPTCRQSLRQTQLVVQKLPMINAQIGLFHLLGAIAANLQQPCHVRPARLHTAKGIPQGLRHPLRHRLSILRFIHSPNPILLASLQNPIRHPPHRPRAVIRSKSQRRRQPDIPPPQPNLPPLNLHIHHLLLPNPSPNPSRRHL